MQRPCEEIATVLNIESLVEDYLENLLYALLHSALKQLNCLVLHRILCTVQERK